MQTKRPWWVWAIVAAVVLVVLATTIVILATQDNNKQTAKTTAVLAASSYQSKLSSALTPVVTANMSLSKALQAISGSQETLRAAKDATKAAQDATVAARGAVALVTVPLSQQTLSQQATQALTQETGYLNAVSQTLADPLGSSAASLQPLASATTTAFVPLSGVAPGGTVSIFGIDNLQSWASGAAAAQKRSEKPKVIVNNNTTVVPSTPPTTTIINNGGGSSGSSGSTGRTRLVGDTVGRLTITAGSDISEEFARNVLIAAANYYQTNGSLPDGVTIDVYSPARGQNYAVTYSSDGSTVTAWIYAGAVADTITFPASDANGAG